MEIVTGPGVEPDKTDLAHLVEPWRTCFELAWEAFSVGSLPVGAVVVDGDGTIVTKGRNRRFEMEADPGQLVNTDLAHAEMNALAYVSHGLYPDHVLYSTLEPCLMCSAAAAHVNIGRIRFAAADPNLTEIDRVPEVVDYIGPRWAVRAGPFDSPLARISALLQLAHFLGWNPDANFIKAVDGVDPGLVTLARQLVTSGMIGSLKTASPSEAFRKLVDVF